MSDSREPINDETTIKLANNIERLLAESSMVRSFLSAEFLDAHSHIRDELYHWLRAKGVPEQKVRTASNLVLANAFKAGDPYVRKMINNNNDFGNFTNLQSNRFNQPRNKKSLLVDLDDDSKSLLRGDEPQTSRELTQEPDLNLNALSDRGIDPAALARAAATAISPRLDAAKRELRAEIMSETNRVEHQVSSAVERRWTEALKTFEEKTQGIVDNIRSDIFKYIDEQTPRKIDITRNGKTIRSLKEESRHKAFNIGLQWLNIGQHLYIVGPAGTGKTHLFKQWGAALDKKIWLVGQALSKYDISGFKGPTGEYFGTVVRDALEFGGLLCIDEGDMWAAAALGFLNAPLANGWCAFPDKTIEVHPDFQCIIAANTFGRGATQEYIGRNPLDAASIDRFAYIIVDYDEDLEINLHGNGPWTQYIQRVRKAIQELKLQHIVSMRATQRLNSAINSGMDPEQALFSSVWRGLSPDTINKIKALAGQPPKAITINTNDYNDFDSRSTDDYDIDLEDLPDTLGGLRDHFNANFALKTRFSDLATFTKAALEYKDKKARVDKNALVF